MKNFSRYGISIPEILLPRNIETQTWSVVACDQYTQDREYWNTVAKIAGSINSTLNIILPEVYLNDSDKNQRIEKIKAMMKDYISGNVFDDEKKEFIVIERITPYGRVRNGLVACIALASY